MMGRAMATNATLSAKADAFLSKLSTSYQSTAEPIMTTPTVKSPYPAPKKLKLLSLEDYKQDIRARWLILQRELYELGIDIKRFINFVTPMVRGIVDKLKSLFSKEKT